MSPSKKRRKSESHEPPKISCASTWVSPASVEEASSSSPCVSHEFYFQLVMTPALGDGFRLRFRRHYADKVRRSEILSDPLAVPVRDASMTTEVDLEQLRNWNNSESFFVEQIMMDKDGKYLVKWFGFTQRCNTWEFLHNEAPALKRSYAMVKKALGSISKRYGIPMPPKTQTDFESTMFINRFRLQSTINNYGKSWTHVEDWLQLEEGVPVFKYSPVRLLSPRAKERVAKMTLREGCSCVTCDLQCSCQGTCGPACICPDLCSQRYLVEGRTLPLILFRVLQRGWGLFAVEPIPKYVFVVEFVGQVKLVEEMKPESDWSYTIPLNKGKMVVDAKDYGNEARFVNHSCDPNLEVRPVYLDVAKVARKSFHRIVFFSKRRIESGEELTLDYTKAGMKKTGLKCLCCASVCRKEF
ncbi:hypothetical protein L596_016626 [Steinernema carpocapsae]|uniref:SET domain-containing protein n=1 Tax=Steinernema carpocapsae TaxID=34508 RepID=A0A4U5NII3_STECR|nr:hypothetical protein L596_016626 [Steinernema carpocapsae]